METSLTDLLLVQYFADGTELSADQLRVGEMRGLIRDRGNGFILTNKGSDLLLGTKPPADMEVSFEEPRPEEPVEVDAVFPSLDFEVGTGLVSPPEPSALDVQVGGSHYRNMKIQPVEFITANNLGFLAGCVIKRICRYKAKNGIEDLEKAKHEIDLLIELELKNGN